MQSSKMRLSVQSLSGLAEYCTYCSMAGPSGSEPTEPTASVLWTTPWAAHNMLIYTLSIHTHTHTLNSNKHMNTLHMCCITSIHVCNSCNSCVAVCTWINSKAWTGSQLKTTTYVRVLIMTMVETPHGQRSEIPRGPDVSRDSSGSRSGAIRSCRAHLWCSTSSDCSQAAGQFPFTLFPILFVSLSFW